MSFRFLAGPDPNLAGMGVSKLSARLPYLPSTKLSVLFIPMQMSNTDVFVDALLWWTPDPAIHQAFRTAFTALKDGVDNKYYATRSFNLATSQWDLPNTSGVAQPYIAMQPMHEAVYAFYEPLLSFMYLAYYGLGTGVDPITDIMPIAKKNVAKLRAQYPTAYATARSHFPGGQYVALMELPPLLVPPLDVLKDPKATREAQMRALDALAISTAPIDIGADISWQLYEDPTEARLAKGDDYDAWPALDLTRLVWKGPLTLVANVDRYGDIQREIEVVPSSGEYITYADLLGAINRLVTTTPLDADDRQELQEAVAEGDDMFKYKADALKKDTIYWTDIMGDAQFFEGIGLDPQNKVGQLHTGS